MIDSKRLISSEGKFEGDLGIPEASIAFQIFGPFIPGVCAHHYLRLRHLINSENSVTIEILWYSTFFEEK
jgi:hypothetical protein